MKELKRLVEKYNSRYNDIWMGVRTIPFPDDTIFDETQSVSWNRIKLAEENKRRRDLHLMAQRLFNEMQGEIRALIPSAIMADTGCSEDQCDVIMEMAQEGISEAISYAENADNPWEVHIKEEIEDHYIPAAKFAKNLLVDRTTLGSIIDLGVFKDMTFAIVDGDNPHYMCHISNISDELRERRVKRMHPEEMNLLRVELE